MSCKLLAGTQRRLIRWEQNTIIQMSNRCLQRRIDGISWLVLNTLQTKNSCKYLTGSHTDRPAKLKISWLVKKCPKLCGPKHYYLAHNGPVLTLSWAIRIQSTTSCPLSIRFIFNIILSSAQEYSKFSPFLLLLKILNELIFPTLSTCPANLVLLFSIRTTGHSHKNSYFLSWWRDIAFV